MFFMVKMGFELPFLRGKVKFVKIKLLEKFFWWFSSKFSEYSNDGFCFFKKWLRVIENVVLVYTHTDKCSGLDKLYSREILCASMRSCKMNSELNFELNVNGAGVSKFKALVRIILLFKVLKVNQMFRYSCL